jgi:hypothetical protein
MSTATIRESSEPFPAVGAAASLRFELDLASAEGLEDRDDPFVPLSEAGRYSRVLLGRIASGRDTCLTWLAVKIQRGAYRPAKESLANPQIEDLWDRERASLDQCSGAGVAKRIDLAENSFRSLPVTFCKKVRRYFHVPCPSCGRPLSDCRDDALLRDHGLSQYSTSSVRFLHCPECGAKSSKKVFYTASTAGEGTPRGGAEVRHRGELYRDFAALVRTEEGSETRLRLGNSFPCAGCDHRKKCYPASGTPIPAESLLVPLSYHEFHLLPMEAFELHYDEFADLVGGAEWASVRDKAVQSGGEGRARLMRGLDEAFSSPSQWFWRGHEPGRWSLEVLRLKLHLFSGLCRGVRTLHAQCHTPHLNLSPSSVMVRLVPPVPGVPVRWNFQVGVIGPASAHRPASEAGQPPPPAGLIFPAPDVVPAYLSPFARDAGDTREETLRITLVTVREEGGSIHIGGTATSDRVRLDRMLPRDVLRILPSTSAGSLESLILWAVVEGQEEHSLRFTAVLPGGTSLKPCTFDGAVTHYRTLQGPCDLFGLGMLLFRTLLVNDDREFFAADAVIQRILKQISLKYEGREAPSPHRVIDEMLHMIDEEKEVFAESSILHSRVDRAASLPAIPARLWSDTILLAFRLVTSVAGFSFAADHSDYDAEQPGDLMDRVLRDLTELQTRVEVELFSRGERDREISEICSTLIGQTTGASGDKGSAP